MLKGKKIGFIGAGNMGSAIVSGLVKSGAVAIDNVYVADIDKKKASDFGGTALENAKAVAQICDVVIIAIKPQVYDIVLKELSSETKPLYISIAAGITSAYVSKFFSSASKVIRVMPNTPALIGEGMTAVCDNGNKADVEVVCEIFSAIGRIEVVPEKFMDAIVSVSGSSPAYVYIMIEAMADAAVKEGLPRDMAYRMAAQSVAGSAKMVLETNMHPGQLKDNVCSPGGTTIEAVAVLENSGFRSSIIEAMSKCTEKSKKLTK